MREPAIHHRQATRYTETPPPELGNAPLARAIVLHRSDENVRTLGFPALNRAETKRVRFSTPLYAKCMSADGLWSIDCLVLTVWDIGAELQVQCPSDLTEFHLLFTSSARPVFRQCRRVRTRGHVIEVAYLRKQPDFLLKAGLDL